MRFSNSQKISEALKRRYPDRCLKVLIQGARNYVGVANKRSDYRWLAKKLKNICTYDGGAAEAQELAVEFVEKYPRRKAMIEELSMFLP